MKPLIKTYNASGLPNTFKKRGKHSAITDQEKERILELKAQGKTDREIADIMGRATYSVNRVCNKSKKKEVRKGYFEFDGKMF